MAKSKLSSKWDHTASILTVLHNSTASKKNKMKYEDFHPFKDVKKKRKKQGKKGQFTGVPLNQFKKFCKNRKGLT